MLILWILTPYELVDTCQSFGGTQTYIALIIRAEGIRHSQQGHIMCYFSVRNSSVYYSSKVRNIIIEHETSIVSTSSVPKAPRN
jgi:hypothetical protein